MAEVQGELENVRLFRDVIKSSLGPNGLSKILVHLYSGKISSSTENMYENFFLNVRDLVPTKYSLPNNDNNTNKAISSTQNAVPPQARTSNSTTITTMVAALLKAQQYMLNNHKDGSTSTVLLAANFLYVTLY